MTVIFQSGYTLPGADEPLTHARIAHSGNWITGGTATAPLGGTDADFFVDGPDNSLTYERWKPSSMNAIWTNTFSGSETFDYCCIAAHTLGTDAATITVQINDGGAWTAVTPATLITDDSPIFCIFEPQTDTAARVSITGSTAPEVGVIKFGSALQMERPLYGGHSPIDLARQTEIRNSESMTGEFIGKTKQRTHFQTDFAWNNLTAAWVRTNWRPFQIALETEAFFIAWRPTTFGEVGYCNANQMPIPQNIGTRDLMSVSLSARGYGYD